MKKIKLQYECAIKLQQHVLNEGPLDIKNVILFGIQTMLYVIIYNKCLFHYFSFNEWLTHVTTYSM